MYQSLMGLLREMEALVAAVVVWLGSARSVKMVVKAWSKALVVPGVGPLDQW
jgi:hypothetical protein